MGKAEKDDKYILFKKVEKVLKECKHYKTYIKIFELNKQIHSDDEEYIKNQNEKIEYYKKMDFNVSRSLNILSEDEFKFIEEKYYNNKTYRQLIPLISKIVYGDENINKKIKISFSRLLNNGSTVKNIILTKLLSEKILG